MPKTDWFDLYVEIFGKQPSYEEIWVHFGYIPPKTKKLGKVKYAARRNCLHFDDREISHGCMDLKKTYCCYEGDCSFYQPRGETR